MMRCVLAALLAIATAPLQCGHTSDASLREDDTPGDALWALAQQFREGHDRSAEKRTLEYLITRYPASRWVPAAREELEKLGGGAAEGGGP
jgi:hypothetical protein